MNWHRLRLKYWRDLFGKKQLNQDLDEEIQAHIAIETRRRIDGGESPQAARTEALRQIRSVALVAESTRQAWTWTALERLSQDLRYSGRMLLRTPLFAAIVVLSLAIGIGANTTLFSLVDSMLLRKLPVDRPDDLVFFEWHSGPRMVMGGITGNANRDPVTHELTSTSFSKLAFEEFRRGTRTLSSVFAFAPLRDVIVGVDGHAEVASGQLVSGNYFSGLGSRAVIGRTITDQDEEQSQAVAVISHRFWQRRFASDPAALGKSVTLNGAPFTIIGITQPGFAGALGFGEPRDISVPLPLEAQFRDYDNARIARLYAELQESIANMPGVVDATLASYPLVSGAGDTRRISVEGIQLRPAAQTVRSLTVRANFFDTIGAPILAGRNISPRDTADSPRVALVNETFARTVFGSANPVGAHFGFNQKTDIEIVGVVRDVRVSRARDAVPLAVYLPDLQDMPGGVTFTVRTAGDPLLLLPAIRALLHSKDPNLPLIRFGTQKQQVRQSMTTERTVAFAAAFFGLTALALSCIGLFGLMSYSVERRRSEIGLRMALGARAFDVVQLVMRQSLFLVLLGTAIGVAGAFAGTRIVAKFLFQVAPDDPLTLVVAVSTMLGIACLAAYLPARRAARVNPTVVLRSE